MAWGFEVQEGETAGGQGLEGGAGVNETRSHRFSCDPDILAGRNMKHLNRYSHARMDDRESGDREQTLSFFFFVSLGRLDRLCQVSTSCS